jgi:transposase
MTKQVEFYIGLDVHVNSTQYAVRTAQGDVIQEGCSSTKYSDVKDRLEPYYHSCVVGMETCTAFYPLRKGFLKDKVDIRVANLHRIRQLIVKTDPLDAKRLSDMLRLGSFPESFIPDEKIQELRDLVQTRHRIMEECVKIKCRLWAAAIKQGIRRPTKGMFTQKSLVVLEEYVKSDKSTLQIRTLFNHYNLISRLLQNTTAQVTEYTQQNFKDEWNRIQRVRGIGTVITPYIIAEICPVSRFSDKKKLRMYAGVVPCIKQSGGKSFSSGMLPKFTSRRLLRWALIQAAHHAVKIKGCSLNLYFKSRKKTKQKAIMCVARCISDKVYYALSAN